MTIHKTAAMLALWLWSTNFTTISIMSSNPTDSPGDVGTVVSNSEASNNGGAGDGNLAVPDAAVISSNVVIVNVPPVPVFSSNAVAANTPAVPVVSNNAVVANATAVPAAAGPNNAAGANDTPDGHRKFKFRGGDKVVPTANTVTRRISTARSPVREAVKLKKSKTVGHWYEQNVRAMKIELGKPDCGANWHIDQDLADQVYEAIVNDGRTYSNVATTKRLLHEVNQHYASGKRGNILKLTITEIFRDQLSWKCSNDNRIPLRPMDRATLGRHADQMIDYIDSQHPTTPAEIQFHGNVFIEQRLLLDDAYRRFSEFYEYKRRTPVQQAAPAQQNAP